MEQPLDLPNDIEVLRALVLELRQENHTLRYKQCRLQEQIRLLLHKRFGANSEKYHVQQTDIFNEAEAFAEECTVADADIPDGDKPNAAVSVDSKQIIVSPTYKPGRKALPAELPQVEILHDLPADERFCSEGHALKEIGNEISEQLDIIPAQVRVLRHIRKKYACPCCQGE